MKKDDCIFCKIAQGEIPTELIYQDDSVCAFKDLNPLARVHILIIPKDHMANLNDYAEADEKLLGHILIVAAKIAREQGISESGYRVVSNCGPDAGQSVFHTHFHLIGGQQLSFNMQ